MAELAARLFDPWALLLVLGGTLLTAMLSATREDMGRALAAIAPLLRARPAADGRAAACALHDVERITELKGVACADHVQADSAFVRRACLHLADAPSAEAFAQWAHEEMDARTARHQAAVAVWRSAADAAPAMGMIGTVIGLIGMFATMDDADRIGVSMALAMLTTLYGLVLSALFAGPVAARLERLSNAERRWQGRVVARLEALARTELADTRAWLRQRARPSL